MYDLLSLLIGSLFQLHLFSQSVPSWVVGLEGGGHDRGVEVLVDDNNDVLSVGYFHNNITSDDLSVTLTSLGNADAIITKTDEAGNLYWIKQLGSVNNNITIFSAKIDNDNNYLISGAFGGDADFDPNDNSVYSLTSTNTVGNFQSSI